MNSILITGCNRGIGLGLIKTLIKLPKPPKHLFATCRDIQQAVELKKLADENKNLHILQIDLRDFNLYENLVKQIENVVQDDGLNVLFNNAAISPKSYRIQYANETDLIETFTTNTIVPIMLSKAFIPLLKKASIANESSRLGVNRAAIINMSSTLGSIQENTNGGLYPYRLSKTALNSATKSLSIDLKDDKILCVSVHPGWVRTRLGGAKAPTETDMCCKNIIETMMQFNEIHNGGFYQYDGKQVPW